MMICPLALAFFFNFLPAFLNIEAAVAAPAESPLVIVSYLIYEPGGGDIQDNGQSVTSMPSLILL